MNHLTAKHKLFATLALAISSLSTFAQDVDISLDSDGLSIDTEQWYENPLVWAGFVLLIVVLILLSRRGAKS